MTATAQYCQVEHVVSQKEIIINLKSTVRTLWKEEILKEQTNDIKVVLNNALLERDSKIEGIEGQLAQKDQQINEMKTQLQVRIRIHI